MAGGGTIAGDAIVFYTAQFDSTGFLVRVVQILRVTGFAG